MVQTSIENIDAHKASFVWDRHYVTGLPTVDEQHHKLVNLINEFGYAITNRKLEATEINQLLDELSAYAAYHFREEEQLMADNKLQQSFQDEHRATHQKFIDQIALMTAEFRSKGRDVADDLLDFLCHWLAYHILGSDQKMARQIRLIECGMPPDRAWKQVNQDVDSVTAPLLNALSGLFDLLTEKNHKLLALNASLDAKVQERTRELEKANRKLQEISLTDELSGLPNRRYALQQLSVFWQEALAGDLPLACMMIDIDHFKTVNDKFGHDVGDTVLRALSQTLRDTSRSDDFVARLGGDEFFIICPQTTAAGAATLAETLRAKVAAMHVSIGNKEVWDSSISIGIAAREENPDKTAALISTAALIKAADEAVFAAKLAGKNCIRIAD